MGATKKVALEELEKKHLHFEFNSEEVYFEKGAEQYTKKYNTYEEALKKSFKQAL